MRIFGRFCLPVSIEMKEILGFSSAHTDLLKNSMDFFVACSSVQEKIVYPSSYEYRTQIQGCLLLILPRALSSLYISTSSRTPIPSSVRLATAEILSILFFLMFRSPCESTLADGVGILKPFQSAATFTSTL